MTIIIGLGNPGEQYKNTRHNVGFMAVDAFAEKNSFPEFKLQKKSNSLVSLGHSPTGEPEKDDIILVKPQTFMNESGKAVHSLTKNYPLKTNNLVVVHDDIDLPVGTMKIIKERGSAGHKGVESIIQNIGNEGLVRIRIGIGGSKDIKAMKIVLKNFSEDEQKNHNCIWLSEEELKSFRLPEGHQYLLKYVIINH